MFARLASLMSGSSPRSQGKPFNRCLCGHTKTARLSYANGGEERLRPSSLARREYRNTAHYGWPRQVKATADLLKSGVVSVDIFTLSGRTSDRVEMFERLDGAAAVAPGQSVSVDVVVANRGVGHSFPAELRDMFEAWLELKQLMLPAKC